MEIENKLPDNQEIIEAERSLDEALQALKEDSKQERQTLKLKPKQDTNQLEEIDQQSDSEEPQNNGSFVETDDPVVQRRINELYKDSKIANESNILLKDELRRITEELERRENEYQKRLSELENRNNKVDEEYTLTNLRSQYNEAIQNFDYEKAAIINEKIVDFKTEQKLNAIIKQQKPAQKQVPSYSEQDPIDVAELNILSTEKDQSGQTLRPWLQPNHPKFDEVVNATAIIADRFLRKGQKPSLSSVIREVEKIVPGLKINKAPELKHPPVLSSNTAIGASSDNQANKLTPEQKYYASKLGLSEKEYSRVLKYSSGGPISVELFKK